MNILIGMILLLLFTWIVSKRDPQSEVEDLGLRPVRSERDLRR